MAGRFHHRYPGRGRRVLRTRSVAAPKQVGYESEVSPRVGLSGRMIRSWTTETQACGSQMARTPHLSMTIKAPALSPPESVLLMAVPTPVTSRVDMPDSAQSTGRPTSMPWSSARVGRDILGDVTGDPRRNPSRKENQQFVDTSASVGKRHSVVAAKTFGS